MYTADYFIKNLDMIPHEEGRFSKETFVSKENISVENLNNDIYKSRKL